MLCSEGQCTRASILLLCSKLLSMQLGALCHGVELVCSACAAIWTAKLDLYLLFFSLACRTKKRPRVAAAPERYTDLISNMTSQGGGEDTDSDADDRGDGSYKVRSRRNQGNLGTASRSRQCQLSAWSR